MIGQCNVCGFAVREDQPRWGNDWHLDCLPADLLERAAEVETLRQGLWDVGAISGMDTDGDTKPHGRSRDLVMYIKSEVQELRDGYDEACETEHRLQGLLDQAREGLREIVDVSPETRPWKHWRDMARDLLARLDDMEGDGK